MIELEKTYVIKHTWIDINTAKLKGGYMVFYSKYTMGTWYDTFKFTKRKEKASVLTYDKMTDKIKLFDLTNIEKIEVDL